MDAELESLEARARDAEAIGKEVARLESILDANVIEVMAGVFQPFCGLLSSVPTSKAYFTFYQKISF